MANFDTMTFTAGAAAQQIIDDLAADSFVRATGATQYITGMEITPRSTNSGAAMYWGRSNVTTAYGSRILKGVSKQISWDNGAINVNDIYMVGDDSTDKADIVFTLS